MKVNLLTIYKSITGIGEILTGHLYNCSFKFLLWIYKVDYGSGIRVKGAIPALWKRYGSLAHMRIGSNVTFVSYASQSWNSKCKIMIENNGLLNIGSNTGFNGVSIYCSNSITIGDYVKVGGGTRIFDTDFHPINYLKRREDNLEFVKSSPIVIEDDVFIGTNCIIGKGVTIGARSIIAAGSVVVKSIPEDCIAGGNPCKVIKQLNN